MRHRIPVIDGDGHVYEDDDVLIGNYNSPHAITKRNRSLSIFPALDGWPRGVMHERGDKNPNRPFHTDAKIWSATRDKKSLKYTIDAFGPDRIIYASDFPHEPTEDAIAGAVPALIHDLDYGDALKEKILSQNARQLYHITECRFGRPRDGEPEG